MVDGTSEADDEACGGNDEVANEEYGEAVCCVWDWFAHNFTVKPKQDIHGQARINNGRDRSKCVINHKKH